MLELTRFAPSPLFLFFNVSNTCYCGSGLVLCRSSISEAPSSKITGAPHRTVLYRMRYLWYLWHSEEFWEAGKLKSSMRFSCFGRSWLLRDIRAASSMWTSFPTTSSLLEVPSSLNVQMRRGARKAALNLLLFIFAIIILLYINSTPNSNVSRTFDWTKVRYALPSGKGIPPHGVCPGLAGATRPALVVARTSNEDKKWLDELNSKYHLCVYTADVQDLASNHLQLPKNRGHESMAYLTFIIDNYVNIPVAGAVFVHGSRLAWHNDHPDYDNAKLLAALNIQNALEKHGYHNLRCDWSASTCPPKEAPPQGSYETRSRAMLEPWNERAISDAALPAAFALIFGGDTQLDLGTKVHMGRNDPVRSQCCAQFVVSRESIWQHTREEYVALRQWLLDGPDQHAKHEPGAASPDDRVAGRILSYIWHIIFIRRDASQEVLDLAHLNSVGCPTVADCYCRLYGRCDLTCKTPGHCQGQYRVPPDFKLPDLDTQKPI
jgi:hypothetical protein